MKSEGAITNEYPRVLGIGGSPKVGKTVLVTECITGAPEWFGTKGAYFEIDPDGAGSIRQDTRKNWTKWSLDSSKYLRKEMLDAVKYPWEKEGVGVVVFDTFSVMCKMMLGQIAQMSMFGNNVDVDGVKHPSPGDYGAVDLAVFDILNAQLRRSQTGGPVFINIYHEHQVEPEQGKAGEVIGGPLLAGKKLTDKVVGWHNFYGRYALRAKKRANLTTPQEFERVLFTETRGIWKAGIRLPDKKNPFPEIIVDAEPSEMWRTLAEKMNPSATSVIERSTTNNNGGTAV